MTRITAAIDAAIADLEWFKIPHTVDQIIGLHAQALGDDHARRFTHGATNEQLIAAIAATDYGAGGLTDPAWSDPTCAAALATDPADGDTVTAIDWACRHLAADADELSWTIADTLGHGRRTPPQPRPGRQNLVAAAVAQLHHSRPHLTAAEALHPNPAWLHELTAYRLGENAAWLRTKGEAIWDVTRGASQQTTSRQLDVTCFAQMGENVAESCTKGTRVVVVGRLQQRSWENDQGEKRSKVEIIADEVAPSLRWATAQVQKIEREQASRPTGGTAKPAASYAADEEPF